MNDSELFALWLACLFLVLLFVIGFVDPALLDYIGVVLALISVISGVIFVLYYPIYYFLH